MIVAIWISNVISHESVEDFKWTFLISSHMCSPWNAIRNQEFHNVQQAIQLRWSFLRTISYFNMPGLLYLGKPKQDFTQSCRALFQATACNNGHSSNSYGLWNLTIAGHVLMISFPVCSNASSCSMLCIIQGSCLVACVRIHANSFLLQPLIIQ